MLQATNGLFLLADIWRESGPRTEDEYGTKDEGNKVPVFLGADRATNTGRDEDGAVHHCDDQLAAVVVVSLLGRKEPSLLGASVRPTRPSSDRRADPSTEVGLFRPVRFLASLPWKGKTSAGRSQSSSALSHSSSSAPVP